MKKLEQFSIVREIDLVEVRVSKHCRVALLPVVCLSVGLGGSVINDEGLGHEIMLVETS